MNPTGDIATWPAITRWTAPIHALLASAGYASPPGTASRPFAGMSESWDDDVEVGFRLSSQFGGKLYSFVNSSLINLPWSKSRQHSLPTCFLCIGYSTSFRTKRSISTGLIAHPSRSSTSIIKLATERFLGTTVFDCLESCEAIGIRGCFFAGLAPRRSKRTVSTSSSLDNSASWTWMISSHRAISSRNSSFRDTSSSRLRAINRRSSISNLLLVRMVTSMPVSINSSARLRVMNII